VRLSREMRLVSRPAGKLPAPGDVSLVEVPVPDPMPNQVVVRNLFMSIDPGSLLRMNDLSSVDIPDFQPGAAMWSDAIGMVVDTESPDLSPGDVVWHRFGWRDYIVEDADQFRVVDPSAYPSLSHHLCFGMTAYVGIEVAQVRPGDTFYVSSAAGAVGNLAGQIAKLRGASRVIGSAGSPEKVKYLTETLGFDVAFDYHDGISSELDELDIYFDNVGGSHLEAAIEAMKPRGRIVMCGGMEEIRSGVRRGPRNMLSVIGKRLTMMGFYTFDHPELFPRFDTEFSEWVRSGDVIIAETIVDGLENGVQAAIDHLNGVYIGKVVLRI
jgi:NADPH-dependent curcumin reductase CurA